MTRKATKRSKTRKAVKTTKKNSAGKARAEGLRLFTLAGRPKKGQFIAVFGQGGDRMTWQQRAAAAGLASAEEAATRFQSLLAKASR
jgi:hypothetical protein